MQTKRRSTYERIVWEEGLEAGIERGLAQGRDTGRLEGRLEGRHTAAQELLLDLLAERFGPCSDGLRQRIEAIRDEARMRQLARAVLTGPNLPEFEARIDG